MGLADWFTTFCSALTVKNRDDISVRYGNITKRLNTDFWSTTSETSHSWLVGSYGRGTAINGSSDVDMVFELPSALYFQYDKYTGNGQSALLQAVRASIMTTYRTTGVGGDGQVTVARFSDGITFEVVPVFKCQDETYIFPNSNGGGSWRPTDPRPEIQAIRDRDVACNGNLRRLCRMMRAWKNKHAVPMGGLLIDTLAYQFIGSWEYRDQSYLYYDYMCRDFFKFMAGQDKAQTYWRAPGSEQQVRRTGIFQWKARKCYEMAVGAIKYEKQERMAKARWRVIFGTAFPN